jgi:hypothetical protein
VAGYKNETGTLIGVILNTDSYTISASAAEMKKLFQWAEENIVRIYY